jgi:hypothetical protein
MLILESSLQVFFYDHLQEFNKKSLSPLRNETIYYSSLVMDHFGESSKFFEQVDGKSREKILGIKFLEAGHLPKEKRKAAIKDIAETSLLVCGFFSDSLNKKIIDVKYYQDLGMMAYGNLNSMVPNAYDVPAFYKNMANSFSSVALLMSLVAKKNAPDVDQPWLITNLSKAS